MKTIELSASSMKDKRLSHMRTGVMASARACDTYAREMWGDPESYQRVRGGKTKRYFYKSSPFVTSLVTLTYRPDVDWSPKHIALLLTHYRNYFKRVLKQPFLYVWVVELQQLGKPHYHIIVWIPRGQMPPKPDDQGWWPHGSTNVVLATSPVGYIAKYASKSESKSAHHLPKGARLWGYGGLPIANRAAIAYATSPKWLKTVLHDVDSFPRKRTIHVDHHVTRAGQVIQGFKKTVSAWVITAGIATGWAFLSPYSLDDFTPTGITLTHSGVIEVITPDGDIHFVPHSIR